MARTVRYAAAALELRRLALRLLADPARAGRETWEAAARLPGEAWIIFLEAEQCAGPLAAAVARIGGDPSRHQPLSRWVTAETKLVLAARAQLATIAAAARELGGPMVALKGGVVAAEGGSLHLLDLDVLVPEEQAVPLAHRLSGDATTLAHGRASLRHLPSIGAPFTLPVEVHTRIDNRWTRLTDRAWSDLRPLKGYPDLRRLSPRYHLLHILAHVVIDHPDRRGRIRDALLLESALAACSPDDLLEVVREITASPYARYLAEQLDFCKRLAGGDGSIDSFETTAFARYWMFERRRWFNPLGLKIWERLYPSVWQWVVADASGWSSRQQLADGLAQQSASPSGFGPTRWLERRSPRSGRALRVALRLANYASTFVVARPIVWMVRRAARTAGVR